MTAGIIRAFDSRLMSHSVFQVEIKCLMEYNIVLYSDDCGLNNMVECYSLKFTLALRDLAICLEILKNNITTPSPLVGILIP